jgi:hypothetical protein
VICRPRHRRHVPIVTLRGGSDAKYTTMAFKCLEPKHLGTQLCPCARWSKLITSRHSSYAKGCSVHYMYVCTVRTDMYGRSMADNLSRSPPLMQAMGWILRSAPQSLRLCPAGCAARKSGSCTLCVADTVVSAGSCKKNPGKKCVVRILDASSEHGRVHTMPIVQDEQLGGFSI